MAYTFSGRRYLTQGIANGIDPAVQLTLWALVDELVRNKPAATDYLQVFDLEPHETPGKTIQRVLHTQEVPPYRQEHFVEGPTPVRHRIFVIDDGDHCTMLMAEEY